MRACSSLLAALCLATLPACGLGGFMGDQSGAKFDTPVGESMAASERVLAQQVHALVNAERAVRGLPPMVWDEAASDVGYDHCVDMRVRGYYAHVNPDGETPCDRMQRGGVIMDGCAGENLARHNESAPDVVAAWMASPPHREGILSPGITHVGVGVHTGSGGPWWALEFLVRYE